MELWKVEKFCVSASVAELQAVRDDLRTKMAAGQLDGTNAAQCLRCVERHLAERQLKTLFDDQPFSAS